MSKLNAIQKMFRRKQIGIDINEESNLVRVLGLIDIIGFGCAMTIGAGIFVISGHAALITGASICISFIIGAISCIFSGLCYCEFATRIPVAGSSYTFAYASMGEIIGYIIGWNVFLEYGFGTSIVAQSFSNYLRSFMKTILTNFDDDNIMIELTFGKDINDYISINIVGGLLIIILMLILLNGIKASSKLLNIIAGFSIIFIITFIIGGSFFVDKNNWIKPCNTIVPGDDDGPKTCNSDQKNSFFGGGISGVFHASSLSYFSYIGFEALTTLAEETKNPKRNIVWGLFSTVVIATILYIGVGLVLTGMVPYQAISDKDPLSDAFYINNQKFIAGLIAFAALIKTGATAFSCLTAHSRLFYRMAFDGLFCKKFENIQWSIICCGIISCCICVTINSKFLANMVCIGTLFAYIIVCSGILIIRYENNMENSKIISIIVTIYGIVSISFCFALKFLILNETNIDDIVKYAIVGGIGFILVVLIIIMYGIHFKYGSNVSHMDSVFICPGLPLVPLFGIFVNAFMISSLDIKAVLRVCGWTILGLIIYFLYGIKHSKLNNIWSDSTLLINETKSEEKNSEIITSNGY